MIGSAFTGERLAAVLLTTFCGLTPIEAGSFAARIVDVIMCPCMGHISDNFHKRASAVLVAVASFC